LFGFLLLPEEKRREEKRREVNPGVLVKRPWVSFYSQKRREVNPGVLVKRPWVSKSYLPRSKEKKRVQYLFTLLD
jgi:hypothetical protein